ncbi:MAG: HAD family hydrolase [Candidatus Dojkabacteria bacterium]|nr:MAG: HAD family hydrolase [Candidatus Dojkabacteria bacterium]
MEKQTFKQHFVFDLDDTLVDGRQFCGETMARAITQLAPDVNFDLIVKIHDSIRGMIIEDLYRTTLKEINRDLDVQKLLDLDKQIQKENIDKMKIFEGVVNIFEFLKSNGKQLHICTNRYKELMIPILEANGILGYFDTVISCIDEGYKKPNPKCLLDLIEKSGSSKEEFIYFGDSEVDSEFAQNADIDFIIFDQYLNRKNLFKNLINMFLENKMNGHA